LGPVIAALMSMVGGKDGFIGDGDISTGLQSQGMEEIRVSWKNERKGDSTFHLEGVLTRAEFAFELYLCGKSARLALALRNILS